MFAGVKNRDDLGQLEKVAGETRQRNGVPKSLIPRRRIAGEGRRGCETGGLQGLGKARNRR
jgi:hypothetical protein